jgi:hypothetical protein
VAIPRLPGCGCFQVTKGCTWPTCGPISPVTSLGSGAQSFSRPSASSAGRCPRSGNCQMWRARSTAGTPQMASARRCATLERSCARIRTPLPTLRRTPPATRPLDSTRVDLERRRSRASPLEDAMAARGRSLGTRLGTPSDVRFPHACASRRTGTRKSGSRALGRRKRIAANCDLLPDDRVLGLPRVPNRLDRATPSLASGEEQVLRGGRSRPAAALLRARSRARNEAILRLTRPCSLEYAGFGVVGRKNEQVDRRERRAGGEEGTRPSCFRVSHR